MPSYKQKSVAECLKSSSLSEIEKETVNTLVTYLRICDIPPVDSINYLHLYPLGDEVDSMWYKHFSCLSAVTIHLVFEFSRFTPGFDDLPISEQLVLLNNCTWPMLVLMAARKYDLKEDSVKFTKEYIYTREMCYKFFPVDAVDEIFQFFQNFKYLCIDEIESAVLRAILLFTDHSDVSSEKVKENREFYMKILKTYVNGYKTLEKYLTCMLSFLDELFDLSESARARFVDLVVKNREVPCMILDAFDLAENDDTKE